MNNDIENLKKRLIYRSQYRGTKEMDKLVGSFVNTYINNFDSEKLNELEKFLSIDDDNLYKFYNNQLDNIDGANKELLRLFKTFVYKK
jgi:antitoxin CptB